MTGLSPPGATHTDRAPQDQTVVVLAPSPQDAQVCSRVLRETELPAAFFAALDDFCLRIGEESGVALIAEEHLDAEAISRLTDALAGQPPWSDFPLIVLLTSGEHSAGRIEHLLSMGNVTLIKRPLRIAIFVNTLRARLRDRNRQYAVRDFIREQEQARLRTAADSRRIKMALNAGKMGAWEQDAERVYWSPKMFDLFGYSADTVASAEAAYKRVHEDDRDQLIRVWREASDQSDIFHHTFRIRHPSRGTRWIETVGEPVKNNAGRTQRYAGLTWDITDQREASEKIEHARHQAELANQAKSEFLANMSHEIRTPMTAILGYAEVVANLIDHPEAAAHLKTIRRNGAFLLEIINDILDLSKIEADKLDIVRDRFDPAQLVEDVRSVMDVRATEGGLELDIEYRGEIPSEINSDPKRLKQILINLVGNAIKFTKQGGVKVVVSYCHQVPTTERSTSMNSQDGKLRFDIIDSGIGISRIQRDRLFQPFSQGDHNVNREFGGTGLGLAISQRLATMLGGSISVTSEMGKGSTFSVSVAVGDIQNVEMIHPQITVEPIADVLVPEDIQLSCHALVVDDRRDIRFLSRKFLSDAGATVSEAEDGELAVAAVREAMFAGTPPDIIILDMQMPKLDGYASAKALREMGYAGPIIALTADAMQGDMDRCIKSGCNDYLSKPIDKRELLQKIKRYLDNSQ